MSKAAAKLEKVRADRDRLLAAGKPYEALQLYKTLVSRARVRKEWSEAAEVAAEGASALLRSGGADGAGCGGELAAGLVEIYAKSGVRCTSNELRQILSLAALFPPPAAAGSDPAKDPLVVFLKVALKWSQSVAPAEAVSGSGAPDLHLALARRLRALGDKAAAHQQYLRAGGATELSAAQASSEWIPGSEYEEDASLIAEWAQAGSPSELDLFIARAVLQYLCIEDLAGANAVLAAFRKRSPALGEKPLLNFVSFVAELCTRAATALPLFDLLRRTYAPELARDPGLEAYLDKIGEVYMGRVAPKGLMESLLAGLDAKPAQQQQQQQQPSASPAPAAASAAADEPMAPAPDVD